MVHALVEEDPAWPAVYLEFGRRLRVDASFQERWECLALEEGLAATQRGK